MEQSNTTPSTEPPPQNEGLSEDGLGVILCIIIFSVAIFGRFIMVWHYQHIRLFVKHMFGAFDNSEKKFKAVILHCDSTDLDNNWVLQILSKKLCTNQDLPIFIRGIDDFEAGRSEMDILVEAMEHSEKVIFILSPDLCKDKLLLYLWRIAVIMFPLRSIILVQLRSLSVQDVELLPRSLKCILKERITLLGTRFQMSDNSPCVPFRNSEIELFRWPEKEREQTMFWKSLNYAVYGRLYINHVHKLKRSSSWPLSPGANGDSQLATNDTKLNTERSVKSKRFKRGLFGRSLSYDVHHSSTCMRDVGHLEPPCQITFECENLELANTRL